MPVAWDDDSPGDARQLAANVAAVLHRIVEEADQPQMPTVAMAQQWHRHLYTGIELPIAYCAGEVRDTDPAYPELVGYEVRVGRHLAVASCDVPAALERFTADIRTAVAAVDDTLRHRNEIDANGAELYVTLVAVTHGDHRLMRAWLLNRIVEGG